jgi:hypothetical protein
VKDFTVRNRSSQGRATVPVITAALILWLRNRVLNTGREGWGRRVASPGPAVGANSGMEFARPQRYPAD